MFVVDSSSRERLIGVYIYDFNLDKGYVTNFYGECNILKPDSNDKKDFKVEYNGYYPKIIKPKEIRDSLIIELKAPEPGPLIIVPFPKRKSD